MIAAVTAVGNKLGWLPAALQNAAFQIAGQTLSEQEFSADAAGGGLSFGGGVTGSSLLSGPQLIAAGLPSPMLFVQESSEVVGLYAFYLPFARVGFADGTNGGVVTTSGNFITATRSAPGTYDFVFPYTFSPPNPPGNIIVTVNIFAGFTARYFRTSMPTNSSIQIIFYDNAGAPVDTGFNALFSAGE
jgi:hypothetical protein